MLKSRSKFIVFAVVLMFMLVSCTFLSDFQKHTKRNNGIEKYEEQLYSEEKLSNEEKFTIVNKISKTLLAENRKDELILFLTDYVEKNPTDNFNSFWLLTVALTYLENRATPVAKYYFERIYKDYNDLIINGESVHFSSLQNLIQLSETPDDKVYYYNQLLDKFPSKINKTEIYARLAIEYENLGEWQEARDNYKLFLAQKDATTIQILGIPNAYRRAKQLIDFDSFNNKDWTFENLASLTNTIKKAINTQNYDLLERCKSKINFFAMSWRQEDTDSNSQKDFPIRNFMWGRTIHYSNKFDELSSPNEVYLKTWGYTRQIPIWYLYFRKVNFPLDPKIHGNWEWAGIYFGDKL